VFICNVTSVTYFSFVSLGRKYMTTFAGGGLDVGPEMKEF